MAGRDDGLQRPRRFYAAVGVERAAGSGVDGAAGFEVRLDGRTPRSPGGRPLRLPTAALAELVAEEWRGQGDIIAYAAMPATRLAHTVLDVVAQKRDLSVEGVTRFGTADLLCYFAEGPESLVRRQEIAWLPLLDWAREAHGLTFVRSVGIVHRDQPPETLARLDAIVRATDDFTLAGLAFAAPLFGSAILALALRDGRVGAEAAMAASRLDEMFQEERWGVDAEAAARVDAMAVEAVMVERWFAALARATPT
jgi:chaperone required for assembly of F1-ATPase